MLMIVVVRFVFLQTLVSLGQAGTMALLYHLKLSTHYAFRGSPSDLNNNCGMFSVAINYSSATTRWYLGAALEWIHIILFVVVVLTLEPIVEFFVLMLQLLFPLLPGVLALLYHCTHYPSHGGASNASDRCGAICIIDSAGYTNNSWLYGAALK